MAASQIFQRIEKKYMLTEEQYQKFVQAIIPYMKPDQYGKHTICNIYYDTEQFDLIRTSIQKPPYKEKLRLRSYGIPTEESEVFLEIKKKVTGIVYKRREILTYKEAMDYLEKNIYPEKDTQIMREIEYFRKYYQPVPKLFLAYDRVAWYGTEDANLRMTFDTRIRSREEELYLAYGDQGECLTGDDLHLLEIKVPGAFPMWLARILSENQIYPISFSKYGTIYQKKVMEGCLENGLTAHLEKRGRNPETEVWMPVLLRQSRINTASTI